ncbi:hypothetical protein ACH5RR_032300, partial [Cinchona calisaya]
LSVGGVYSFTVVFPLLPPAFPPLLDALATWMAVFFMLPPAPPPPMTDLQHFHEAKYLLMVYLALLRGASIFFLDWSPLRLAFAFVLLRLESAAGSKCVLEGLEAATPASSSTLVHGFSWLYGSSRGEIKLQEIVNGLINTQMYNSLGISIALIFITVGIGLKLSPALFYQWTLDVYERVRFIR